MHTAAYAARPHGNRDAPTTSHMSLEGSLKLTDGGNVAADLIISGGGVAVKYNVYLSEKAASSNSARQIGAAASSRPGY